MNSIFNIQEEQQKYINELGLENSDSLFNKKPSYTIGTHRLLEYSKWCQLQVHGKRVILFQQFQRANSWMGLSSTEWRDTIKLQGNKIEALGLFIGSRGTITKYFINFCN